MLEGAVTRWDVNVVLGEFIAELNASHTYNGGGDEPPSPKRGAGLLGVDWELANGAYRIRHIVRGGPWDADVRAPLAEPGLDVKEGDYVLAVNGMPIDPAKDPWAAFQGLAEATVILTVNAKPVADGARQVVVKTIADETDLRFREWIEQRRKHVDEVTGGRIGYIYVQSTGIDAQNELVRQFMAQWRTGWPDHRRAVQQRRADPGSLHRAAEPADARPLGRALRRGLAVAAGGAPRAEGDAHQRLERVRRRRVSVLLSRGEARAARRPAHVGRA